MGSEEKYKNIFNNILWDQHYISRPPSSRKFGAAGVDDSHIETDDNRVNLSLTFPLFQKHSKTHKKDCVIRRYRITTKSLRFAFA